MDPSTLADPSVKPGTQTTEYWLTVAHTAFQIVTAFMAMLHPGFHISPDVQKFVLAEVPLLLTANGAFYNHARGKVKAAALTAVAQQAAISGGLLAQQAQNQSDAAIAAIQASGVPAATTVNVAAPSGDAAP